MKKILISLTLGAICAGASAASVNYSYAGSDPANISFYGKNKVERYDVAMCINSSDFVGKKIKNIKAYINSETGVEEGTVWLATKLENQKDITPDVMSTAVAVKDADYAGTSLSVMDFSPESEITVTQVPFYIGYSIEIGATSTAGQKNPLALYSVENSDGFWIHTTSSVVRWTNYALTLNSAAIIVAELEGDFPENSISLNSITGGYAAKDAPFSTLLNISNTGANPVTSITYSYTVNGKAVGTSSLTFPDALLTDPASQITVNVPLEGASELGTADVVLTVTEVNGQPNTSKHPSAQNSFAVKSFLPVHRPLVEEYTGLWCGWCPMGFVSMEATNRTFGNDVVVICYHYDDLLAPYAGASYSEVNGYPTVYINRTDSVDSYYGTHKGTDLGLLLDIEDSMNTPADALIDISKIALEGNNVNFTTVVKFNTDVPNADYRIGYVLTESGMKSDEYVQQNYFSGDAAYAGGALQQFVDAGRYVTGLTFNDVAVFINDRFGVENTLPASITDGTEYTRDFSIDISGIDVISNRDNLVVNAFVVDMKEGYIVNANRIGINGPIDAAVGEIEVDEAEVTAREFYDLSGRRVLNPDRGLYIEKNIYSNGKIKAAKILK